MASGWFGRRKLGRKVVVDGTEIEKLVQDKQAFSSYVVHKFQELDRDHDGKLSVRELQPAVADIGAALGLPAVGSSLDSDHIYAEVLNEFTHGKQDAVSESEFKEVLSDILLGVAAGLKRDPIVILRIDGEDLREFVESSRFETEAVSIFSGFESSGVPLSRCLVEGLGKITVADGMPPASDSWVFSNVVEPALRSFPNDLLERPASQEAFLEHFKTLLRGIVQHLQELPVIVAHSENTFNGSGIRRLLANKFELDKLLDEAWKDLPKDRHGKVPTEYLRIALDKISASADLPPYGAIAQMVISKDGGISANWESTHVLIFCDLCIREIDLGNRPTTHFNKEGWVNLIKNFKERTTLEYTRAQMKNKWDQLKRDWKLWRELKRGETGLGWNLTKRTIDASDDWWKERIEMIPNAKKFRSAGIPPELEEKLDKMFSLVVATGDNVWMPSSGELPSLFSQQDTLSGDDEPITEQNNTQAVASDDIGSATPGQSSQSGVNSKRKRKWKKLDMGVKQLMLSHVEKLCSSSDVFMQRVAAPVVPPSIYLLREAIQELEKYPEIFEDSRIYHFATVHFQTPVNRVTFLSIPEDRRVEWLKTHYMNSLK